jgi:ABC-type branched-subunit amino acid transport system substrate-binding protein
MPDKFMALGAASLQIWAMAANELKTLDREAIAKRITGGSFKGTIMGDVTFEPNGQQYVTVWSWLVTYCSPKPQNPTFTKKIVIL